MRLTKRRTAAVTGAAISVTGGRSNETPRYLRGMTPLSVRARARLTRWARQRQSLAVFVASSTTKPLPSQTSNGQRSSRLAVVGRCSWGGSRA